MKNISRRERFSGGRIYILIAAGMSAPADGSSAASRYFHFGERSIGS
jgi:hypothetical protein